MSEVQREALRVLDAAGAGAVHCGAAGWVWRHDVRESEQAAQAVLDRRSWSDC